MARIPCPSEAWDRVGHESTVPDKRHVLRAIANEVDVLVRGWVCGNKYATWGSVEYLDVGDLDTTTLLTDGERWYWTTPRALENTEACRNKGLYSDPVLP